MDGTCRCSAALPHLRRRCRGRHNSVKPSFPPVSFSLSLSLRLLRPVCKIDDGRRSRCCCRFSIARARSILPKLFCATLFCRWVSGALHGAASVKLFHTRTFILRHLENEIALLHIRPMGQCSYDICTDREGGTKSDQRNEIAWIRY